MVLGIYPEKVDCLETGKIAEEFISRNERREKTFGRIKTVQ